MKIKILSGRGYNDMRGLEFPIVVEAEEYKGYFYVKRVNLESLCRPDSPDLERVFMPDVVEVL